MIGVCFDLDGTLVKSDKIHVEAFNQAFMKNGLKKIRKKKLVALFGNPKETIIDTLYPNLNKVKRKKILLDHNRIVVNNTAKFVKVIPGTKTTLKKLHRKYKLALLTNNSHKEIIAILKYAKIDRKMFNVIGGADDVKVSKPKPEGILFIKKKLRIKKFYMVGDTKYDIIAARRARVKSIAVKTGSQPFSQIKKEKPDYVVKSIKEIPKLMEKIETKTI